MTVAVAAGALVLALVLGLVIALLRMSRSRLFSGFAYIYTEFLRGTPALAQLFVIYFGLPDIGIELRPVEAAIVGLGINGSAYLSEVYRAGIQAIHRGQFEAAFARNDAHRQHAVHRPAAGRSDDAAANHQLLDNASRTPPSSGRCRRRSCSTPAIS